MVPPLPQGLWEAQPLFGMVPSLVGILIWELLGPSWRSQNPQMQVKQALKYLMVKDFKTKPLHSTVSFILKE